MTHDDLVIRAVRWLRKTEKCGVAVPELVTYAGESPDAIGWRSQGQICIIVECKVSRADFLRDKHKPARRNPEDGVGNLRYFMTPPGLIDPTELPKDKHGATWGLLEVGEKQVRRVVDSGNFAIGYENRKSEMMLYSLVRRVEVRGNLKSCLAKKWGGDGLMYR